MINKLMMYCILVVLLLSGQTLDKEKIAASAATDLPEQNKGRVVPSSFSGDANDQTLLTLNHLRDSGLSLQQIKQQAINIYLEVTRQDVQPEENLVLTYPKSISDKGLLKYGSYLSPRTEWLYFYVGTMEPIIHLFADDVNDTKNGASKVFVPKAAKEAFAPLWQQWTTDIQNLNEHVTAIYKLTNEEKPDNIAIGKHAVSIYKIGNELERTRQKAVALIRKTERTGEQLEPVSIQ